MSDDIATSDWRRDLDIFDERYVLDPASIWAELRVDCPVAFSERRGRAHMPVNYADIAAVARDTDRFSSRRVGVVDLPRDHAEEDREPLQAPPITSDPPEHTWARRLLLPAFSPHQIDEMEPLTRELARELATMIRRQGRGDAARDYAQHIPVRVIAHMIGVPATDEELFTSWAVRILQEGFNDLTSGLDAIIEVLKYFGQRVEERRAVAAANRPDDLLTLLIDSNHEGEPLTERHIVGSCFLLLIAGIDTTWSAIGSSLWHLATHPADQRRLRDEPELIDTAVEEFLRVYSPVTMAREVLEDTDVAGCPVKAGDKILMSFPAGNRDPSVFDRPDEFLIDRERNRHFAFGSGIHRCLGSNLARMELRVAIEEFLAAIPPFELADADAVTWTGGQVRGPRTVPISF